jgi:hypothetical protein
MAIKLFSEILLEIFKYKEITDVKKEGTKKVYYILKTKDRNTLKRKIENELKKNKIKFKEVMSSKSGFPTTTVGDISIVYKPVIAKGTGGKSFEIEFENDLKNMLGATKIGNEKYNHPDVVKELIKIFKSINFKSPEVIPEGSKNQKRALDFSGGKFFVTNSDGKTLTDVTLKDGNKFFYFSLKMSKTYYLINASIFQYFEDKTKQKKAYEFFGLDGLKMGEYDRLLNNKTSVYACSTSEVSESKIKKNIENLVKSALGSDYYFVHKKQENQVTCFYNDGSINVKCQSIESVVYPEAGKRKYTAIKTKITIDGHLYICTLQFRGTTESDIKPKYLRMLMEKK